MIALVKNVMHCCLQRFNIIQRKKLAMNQLLKAALVLSAIAASIALGYQH
jgi:hypothetical protein